MVPAEPRPVDREIGGVAFTDDYAWLEDDTEESLAWQSAQDAAAREHLRADGWYDAALAALGPHLAGQRVWAPTPVAGRWFGQQVRGAGAEQPVLCVWDALGPPGRTLLDPAGRAAELGAPVSLDFAWPSPDGRLVAVGTSAGGSEASRLEVLEVDTGQVRPGSVQLAVPTYCAWLPDSSAFFYSALDPSAAGFALHLRSHDATSGADDAVPGQPAWRHPFVLPHLSADGRLLAAVVDHLAPRPDALLDLRVPGAAWQVFLRDAEGSLPGVLAGDAWVAVSTHGHPRGRLVAVPVDLTLSAVAGGAAPDPSTWRVLAPQGSSVLRCVSRSGERLVVSRCVDADSSVVVLEADGRLVTEVDLPAGGTASFDGKGYNLPFAPMLAVGDSTEAAFVWCDPATSPAVWVADLDTGATRRVAPPASTVPSITVTRGEAPSADGTPVPYRLVHRADADVTAAGPPLPCVLTGYGGFNVALMSGYAGPFAPLIEAGAVLVVCHLRGGGEYGDEWWQGGRLHAKQNTIDDLVAVAEHLVDAGVAAPGRLAFEGGSNGGMLAGAVLAQRPDLWAAVVSDRPVLDLLGVVRDPFTLAAVVSDYGNPQVPADAQVLASYSPYHRLHQDIPAPAALVVCGAGDPRCPPWHGRKFVARLQAASVSGEPALLRVWSGAGHTGADESIALEQAAEWVGFLARALDLPLR